MRLTTIQSTHFLSRFEICTLACLLKHNVPSDWTSAGEICEEKKICFQTDQPLFTLSFK